MYFDILYFDSQGTTIIAVKMENNDTVKIITDKTYFMEETINIHFKFIKKSIEPQYSDWIALYKCSSNRNLEEFIAVETSLTVRSSTKHGLIPVIFYPNQLKNVKCNEVYEFIYGNKFNEICGISQQVRFIHKNDCYCYPNVTEISNCNGCVSQEFVNSLLARMSIVENKLKDYEIQSKANMLMNKHLTAEMIKCDAHVQTCNEFLDNLFYTNEQVTKDGIMWMEPCNDIDLKLSVIENQEQELQNISSQNDGIKKVLENLNNKVKENDNDIKLESMDSEINNVVNVEIGFVPEPSIASIVFIDEDDL
ncbi:Hypothetical protein CINCED_3A004107 [Cinara cedri]|uniref:SKICH domain-containing protein n=1 Tax=Cinara cedri TaxID=506608 RepID=A0A5E4N055_9HEMI|nr:Hypothetical protein CINCED_3A004107 [Cinara cedri]